MKVFIKRQIDMGRAQTDRFTPPEVGKQAERERFMNCSYTFCIRMIASLILFPFVIKNHEGPKDNAFLIFHTDFDHHHELYVEPSLHNVPL